MDNVINFYRKRLLALIFLDLVTLVSNQYLEKVKSEFIQFNPLRPKLLLNCKRPFRYPNKSVPVLIFKTSRVNFTLKSPLTNLVAYEACFKWFLSKKKTNYNSLNRFSQFTLKLYEPQIKSILWILLKFSHNFVPIFISIFY